MALLEMRVDLSKLIDTLATGSNEQIVEAAREHLLSSELVGHVQNREIADVLLGRVGMVAAHGDTDGHIITTLAAAAMLARLLHTIPQPLDDQISLQQRALPLFAQALLFAAPAVRAAHNIQPEYPEPLFPSGLLQSGTTVNEKLHEAIYGNDALLTERLLFGLYGTGADYRTLQVRTYDGIATTFQNAGHPLMFAVRGYQLLDTVEWGNRAPNIIHWLAPHLPLKPEANEPAWIETVRKYTAEPAHSVVAIRKRLSAPKDASALSLQKLILSDADTTQVCQGVYDALMGGEASPRAVGSVIALAAAEIMHRVNDNDREQFVKTAHGLLFAAATRLVYRQVQDVEALPLLFTSAAYVNALHKEVPQQEGARPIEAPGTVRTAGGGLIAPAQLETLADHLKSKDLSSALATARRYLKLGHDARALFGTIGLGAATTDATADQGHTLQIVQAVSEEFMAWPATLAETNIEVFLQVALRAAAFGQQDTLVSRLA